MGMLRTTFYRNNLQNSNFLFEGSQRRVIWVAIEVIDMRSLDQAYSMPAADNIGSILGRDDTIPEGKCSVIFSIKFGQVNA